jgi:hypothetical protein
MLPAVGGTINAMSGGSMSSPYTGDDTAATSMLRSLPPSAAPIAEYKGGAWVEPSPAHVAVAAAIASDLIDPLSKNDAAPVAVAISAAKPTLSKTDPFITAAIAVSSRLADVNEIKPETDKNVKTIIVHGIKYEVTDPTKEDNVGWTTLLKKLHFDVFKGKTKIKIKEMIYNQPTCLENDLPISSLITCAPIRRIIQTILIALLRSGKINDSRSEVKMIFNPATDAKALSKQAKKEKKVVEPEAVEPVEPLEPVELEEVKGGTRKARDRIRRIVRKQTQ